MDIMNRKIGMGGVGGCGMLVRESDISGVFVVETSRREDSRGSFYRAFCDVELDSVLEGRSIRQVNVSRTSAVGAIRGLHFQYPPKAEMKLVRCIRGAVWDVVVDLRKGSGTFLKWRGFSLAERDAQMIVIPEGCGHVFQVLEPASQLLYLHTEVYAPEFEGGVRYDDLRVGIEWPLLVSDVSERDKRHGLLGETFEGIVV
jgi:dTDP-4-dehydrorhamnose 3,5-epimerase